MPTDINIPRVFNLNVPRVFNLAEMLIEDRVRRAHDSVIVPARERAQHGCILFLHPEQANLPMVPTAPDAAGFAPIERSELVDRHEAWLLNDAGELLVYTLP